MEYLVTVPGGNKKMTMGEDNLIEALEEYTKKYKDRPLKVLMGSPAYHAFI